MATVKFCLPLLWVVAAATAAVTPVPTPEASSSTLSLVTLQPARTVSPRPTPGPLGDVETPSPTAPSPEEEPILDVTLKDKEPPGTQEPEAAPEEPGTTASGSTAGPTPGTTEGPSGIPSTSAPPCPGDKDPPEACGAPTGAQRAAVAEALGTFAVRFYRHMVETAEPGANLLFSPLNVALGLSHLLLGARGETQERLAAVLGYPPGLACVHGALQQLAAVPGLLAASQIFHHPGEPGVSGGKPWWGQTQGLMRLSCRPVPAAPLLERVAALLRGPAAGAERQREPGPAAHQRLGAPGHPRAPAPAAGPAAPRATPGAAQRRPLPGPVADAVQGQADGAAALPARRPPARVRAHHDQQEVPRGLLHRLPPAGPGGAAGPERGAEPGGAGAAGSPGGAGDRGAGAGPPDLPGAAAEGGQHPNARHCHRPAPHAPRPHHGRSVPGPRHGLRAVPGRGAVRAGAGPSGGGGHGAAPGRAGAGRGRCGGGGCHGHLGGPHGPAAGGSAAIPLRHLGPRRRHPPLHGAPQRPPALTPASWRPLHGPLLPPLPFLHPSSPPSSLPSSPCFSSPSFHPSLPLPIPPSLFPPSFPPFLPLSSTPPFLSSLLPSLLPFPPSFPCPSLSPCFLLSLLPSSLSPPSYPIPSHPVPSHPIPSLPSYPFPSLPPTPSRFIPAPTPLPAPWGAAEPLAPSHPISSGPGAPINAVTPCRAPVGGGKAARGGY